MNVWPRHRRWSKKRIAAEPTQSKQKALQNNPKKVQRDLHLSLTSPYPECPGFRFPDIEAAERLGVRTEEYDLRTLGLAD
jgi:hypothetical protein